MARFDNGPLRHFLQFDYALYYNDFIFIVTTGILPKPKPHRIEQLKNNVSMFISLLVQL